MEHKGTVGEVVKIPSNKVGVRELRQNLSVYLRRVKAGEALEVMERGHVVAVLTPVRAGSGVVDRLVAAGRAVRGRGSLADLRAPKGPISDDLSRALRHVREERL
jgi:prevent-host-death family protein